MKKIIILIPLLLMTGCTNKEKLFEEYAKTYYENHMKMVNNVDSVTITLDDLQNASTQDDFDMTKLKKCKTESKITLYIDKETKKIKNAKKEIKC